MHMNNLRSHQMSDSIKQYIVESKYQTLQEIELLLTPPMHTPAHPLPVYCAAPTTLLFSSALNMLSPCLSA
jgi:hypothetical protein